MSALDGFVFEQNWAEIKVRLVAFTLRRTKDRTAAEDAVQQALAQFFDPAYKEWSPETPTWKELMSHLRSVVNGILANDARRRMRRGVHLAADDGKLASRDSTDAELNAADWECDVLDRLEGDEDACSVLCLFAEGVTKAAEQAQKLSWPVNRIYEARRRIRKKLREPSGGT